MQPDNNYYRKHSTSVSLSLAKTPCLFSLQEATTHIEKRSTSLNHDEYEAIAQSVCTSMAIDQKRGGWTFAVQRVCTYSNLETCQQLCSSKFLHVQDTQTAHRTWRCLGALHVYKGRPSSSAGTINQPSMGFKVYWSSTYHTWKYCGPNYCCCQGNCKRRKRKMETESRNGK